MRNNQGQFIKGNIPTHKGNTTFICAGCKLEKPRHPYEIRRLYCSLECKKLHKPKVKCSHCGKEKQLPPSVIKQKKMFFCNQKCKAAYQTGRPNEAILGDKHPMKKPENQAKVTGQKHGQWLGSSVGNRSIHKWVIYHYGKANHCSNNLSHTGRFDWANKSYQYLRDISDWEQLCRKCHIERDKTYRKLMKIKTTRFVFDNKGNRNP